MLDKKYSFAFLKFKVGIEVDFVSPKGGKAPMIGVDLQDSANKEFLSGPEKVAKLENTLHPEQSRENSVFTLCNGKYMLDLA